MKPFGAFATIVGLLAVSCAQSSPVAPAPISATAAGPTRTSSIVQIPLFIQDAIGEVPTAPTTPLFEVRKHNPILAPDRHQVTLAEFNSVNGVATAQCVAQGTHVTLQLSHLIPNGLYTIWNVVFRDPGFDPTFANMIGIGALGSPSGTENVFRASASGEGTITATTAAGALSMQGSIGACALTDQFEWHVVGAYHIDAQSHGASLGPDGTAVEQFGFIFKR